MSSLFFVKTGVLWMLWVALSGSYTIANLLLGAVIAGLVVWINPSQAAPSVPLTGRSVMRGIGSLPWLFGRIVVSSVHMARLILDPRLPIDPQVVRYEPTLKHDWAIVLMGNSITLTPGTITVHADHTQLLVHAIDGESAEDLVSGRLERKLAPIFEQTKETAREARRP